MRTWAALRLFLAAMLLVPAASSAQRRRSLPVVADPPVVLAADAPIKLWLSGFEVALAMSTGTVDHVTLNDGIAQTLGLVAEPPDRKADLVIGGRVVFGGRHGGGRLMHDGVLQHRQLYWFAGQSLLPLAGTIGPFALPHWRVRVEWPVPPAAGPAETLRLPLVGGVETAAYGLTRLRRSHLLVGADVRTRRPLPLVTATVGADLAEELGGKFVGERWQEEIMLGVRRPVRRLELNRPLEIGPLKIHAVAVRIGGPRDATATLAPGQIIPVDAEEDPEVMAVRGRIIRQRAAARYIMLSRTQLEAHGCSSLLVDKAELAFELRCAAPAEKPPAITQTAAVPIENPPAVLAELVLPPQPELQLAMGEPVSITLNERTLQLLPGDGGDGGDGGGVLLNQRGAVSFATIASDQLLALLRQQNIRMGRHPDTGLPIRTINRRTGASSRAAIEPMPGTLVSADLTMRLDGRRTEIAASWRAEVNNMPFYGRVSLAALPAERLRLQLGPPPDPAARTELNLPLSDRSHDQAVQGVASLPGIDALFVAADIGTRRPLPVVSLALGDDLERLNGGRMAGPVRTERLPDGRRQSFRDMQLATPLVLGPFRFDRVTVARSPQAMTYLYRQHWRTSQPMPDVKNIPGLERQIRLSMVQLEAQRCATLAVDKPARRWRLWCSPPDAAPTPAAAATP